MTPIDELIEPSDANYSLNSTPSIIHNLSGRLVESYQNHSLYFQDGLRTVDFVLVWESDKASNIHKVRRAIFEKGLLHEGLQLETEPTQDGLNVVKIHAPRNVLKRYIGILKLRMPMKEELCKVEKSLRYTALLIGSMFAPRNLPPFNKATMRKKCFSDAENGCFHCLTKHIKVNNDIFPQKGHRFTAIYSRDQEYLKQYYQKFDLESPEFWSGAVSSLIVQFILDRQTFSGGLTEDFSFGIESLIQNKIYSAAYPLHDGSIKTQGSLRQLLNTEWASISKFYKYQPLDYIKKYFGVKIALYFTWLGFYTFMLIPAALVGLMCFVYSITTLQNNEPSEDICNDNTTITMCPLCDRWCDYWEIKETCFHSRMSYLFDNNTTVFFTVFMSIWATLFLELWKRYSAEINHRWDLTGFDVQEEHPRPKYLARLSHVKKKKLNVVTDTFEPIVPFWKMKVPATLFSFSVVILLVILALATVWGVVLYRMSIIVALSVQGESDITSYAVLFTTATAACINLGLICIFNWIYTWLAEKLTEKELHRTQTEFENSLSLKIYLLQFINYYASIFYIAFFKGKFVGRPGQYNRLFGIRHEECGPGGCLTELCIQLAVIMLGQQAIYAILEISMSAMHRQYIFLCKWWNSPRTIFKSPLQWIEDYKLAEWEFRILFSAYLKMVLQYGFVTIFVAAFPLAPLFALINNILQMRLDAKNMLWLYRRPVPQRANGIGVWYRVLDSIGKLSVITNGFIIAFTSQFIPRLVYRFYYSTDGTLHGYLNQSLSVFDISHFEAGSAPYKTDYNITHCRYSDYREGPTSSDSYEHNTIYWHVLAARLTFIVVFENAVAFVIIMVKLMIPNMSSELKGRIKREAYVIKELIICEEKKRAGLLKDLQNAGDLAGIEGTQLEKTLSHSISSAEFNPAVNSVHFNFKESKV